MDWIWPGGLMALLTLCLLFVNGWTDAPNAIAACVATRCLPLRQAVWMSAACNGVGLLLSVRFGGAVAATIRDMVSLDGQQGNAALCAAMAAVILWAVAAWYFGIPTSESHGLIAGLTGAALALGGGLEGICTAAWIRVLWGLAASVAVGALAGFGAARLTGWLFRHTDRRASAGFFRGAQIAGAAAMSLCHGAQDGQKFLGVLLLAAPRSGVNAGTVLLCAGVMALGTAVGGGRIIRAVGTEMVHLEPWQGFAADAAGSGVLLAATALGLPVSTTHTKTMALLGVGAARRFSAVRLAVARDLAAAWVLTFPGCGLLSFLLTRVLTALA